MDTRNVQEVLDELEILIPQNKAVPIRTCYRELGIFDWWLDMLAVSRQKEMKKFLTVAKDLGYTGRVEFQVGIAGCANGMWAFKEMPPSSNPEVLYKSFTPEYNGWDVCDSRGLWAAHSYDEIRTIQEIKDVVNRKKKAGEISA